MARNDHIARVHRPLIAARAKSRSLFAPRILNGQRETQIGDLQQTNELMPVDLAHRHGRVWIDNGSSLVALLFNGLRKLCCSRRRFPAGTIVVDEVIGNQPERGDDEHRAQHEGDQPLAVRPGRPIANIQVVLIARFWAHARNATRSTTADARSGSAARSPAVRTASSALLFLYFLIPMLRKPHVITYERPRCARRRYHPNSISPAPHKSSGSTGHQSRPVCGSFSAGGFSSLGGV